MDTYDLTEASNGFLAAAEEAERYVREVRGKLENNSSYEHIHDDHPAKFYVFNHLHGRRFLDSRKSLLEELGRLQSSKVPAPNRDFSAERFEHYRQSYIKALIERYESQIDAAVN